MTNPTTTASADSPAAAEAVPALRIWRAWRAEHLRYEKPDKKGRTGWDKFVEDLDTIFLPATWQVMGRYGLLCYVPSLLGPSSDMGLPEEAALLIYKSQTEYKKHSQSVAGRAYGVMHDAVFRPEDTPRSGWATPWPAQPEQAPFAWWRPARKGGARFLDEAAQVLFVAVRHASGAPRVDVDAVFKAVEPDCDAALCTEPRFTLAWLAAAPGRDAADIRARVYAALSPAMRRAAAEGLGAVHTAAPRRLGINNDYFADDSSPETGDKPRGVQLKADSTLLFRKPA